MHLRALARFTNGEQTYAPGDEFHVPDALGAYLVRCSPESFETVSAEPAAAPSIEQRMDAISTETATGLTATDRRMRGGAKRGGKD